MMAPKKIMSVEAMRTLCAVYVFLCHLIVLGLGMDGLASILFRFGQEAVMIFFVISGFVIMTSYLTSDYGNFWYYLFKRALRIYPVFIFAIVVGSVTAQSFNPLEALGNLLMLQDFSGGKPGVLVETYGGNGALWSLSYEWWFYLLFYPAAVMIPEKYQISVVTISAVVSTALFNILSFQPFLFLSYFPIWWAGAEIGRAYFRGASFPTSTLISVGLVAGAFLVPVLINLRPSLENGPGVHPIIELRHFIAALFILVVIKNLWGKRLPVENNFVKGLGFLASISYGIYVLNFPIVTWKVWLGWAWYLKFSCAIIVVFVLAYIAEVPYQKIWVAATAPVGRKLKTVAR